jgi:hypothetical protein
MDEGTPAVPVKSCSSQKSTSPLPKLSKIDPSSKSTRFKVQGSNRPEVSQGDQIILTCCQETWEPSSLSKLVRAVVVEF